MAYNKITNKENALKLINGTSLKDRLVGFNYKQLVAAFGEPTFNSPSGDSKVQKEWVFQRKSDGAVFTLYDWKTYDVNQTENFLQTWNVGGHSYAGEFVNDLIVQLKKKN
jgi:hypothetical protein